MKLNGTHQVIVYGDDAYIFGGSETETLAVASTENHLEVNAEKSRNIFMSRDQYAGQNNNVKVCNK
jgi:hypothetical protein